MRAGWPGRPGKQACVLGAQRRAEPVRGPEHSVQRVQVLWTVCGEMPGLRPIASAVGLFCQVRAPTTRAALCGAQSAPPRVRGWSNNLTSFQVMGGCTEPYPSGLRGDGSFTGQVPYVGDTLDGAVTYVKVRRG